MKPEFQEKQRITRWWFWLLLSPIALIPIYGLYKQIYLGKSFGNKPMSDLGLILFSVGMFLLLLLFRIMELRTSIDNHEIKVQLFPLTKKQFSWRDVKECKVLDYGFIGGWGIRLWTKYGTAYNIQGTKGLAIELNNGKKYLIGTQKEKELAEVISAIRENKQPN